MNKRNNSLVEIERRTLRRPNRRPSSPRGGNSSSLSRLEEQLAVVSGRRRVPPSGALQKLEEDLLGRPRGRVTVAAQSYDAGAPIELRYCRTDYTLVPKAPPVSAETASVPIWRRDAASTWSGDQAIVAAYPYGVESFGEPVASPVAPEPRCEPSLPFAPAADRHQTKPTPGVRDSTTPAVETEKPAPAPALQSGIDDFEADIRAILAQGGAATPEPAERDTHGEPVREEASEADRHAIFDQMGRNMRYANTFNLGAIELDRRFDAFERELDDPEASDASRPVSALSPPVALDEMDVLSDMVEISEAAPKRTASPGAAADGPDDGSQAPAIRGGEAGPAAPYPDDKPSLRAGAGGSEAGTPARRETEESEPTAKRAAAADGPHDPSELFKASLV